MASPVKLYLIAKRVRRTITAPMVNLAAGYNFWYSLDLLPALVSPRADSHLIWSSESTPAP